MVSYVFPNADAERARIGLSRTAFAEKLGVLYGTMKNWMHGTTDIPVPKLVEMSGVFHCSTDYQENWNDEEPHTPSRSRTTPPPGPPKKSVLSRPTKSDKFLGWVTDGDGVPDYKPGDKLPDDQGDISLASAF